MKLLLITQRTDASIGLRLAGVETVCVRSSDALRSQLKKACEDADVGVLMITPGVEELCPETVSEIRNAGRPLLVSVPDSDNISVDSNIISDYIQNAIGIKLD